VNSEIPSLRELVENDERTSKFDILYNNNAKVS
jgi:hypothetical protein